MAQTVFDADAAPQTPRPKGRPPTGYAWRGDCYVHQDTLLPFSRQEHLIWRPMAPRKWRSFFVAPRRTRTWRSGSTVTRVPPRTRVRISYTSPQLRIAGARPGVSMRKMAFFIAKRNILQISDLQLKQLQPHHGPVNLGNSNTMGTEIAHSSL